VGRRGTRCSRRSFVIIAAAAESGAETEDGGIGRSLRSKFQRWHDRERALVVGAINTFPSVLSAGQGGGNRNARDRGETIVIYVIVIDLLSRFWNSQIAVSSRRRLSTRLISAPSFLFVFSRKQKLIAVPVSCKTVAAIIKRLPANFLRAVYIPHQRGISAGMFSRRMFGRRR